MNYQLLIVLFFLVFNYSFAQPVTYFVKYKTSIEKSAVEQKVKSQQIFSGFKKIPAGKIQSVKHLANNIGFDDEALSRIIKIEFTTQAAANEYLDILKADNSIEYVQPSVTYKVESVPNDSLIEQQWALKKIDAFSAWNITTGSDKILIAIIDTGIEFFHPDLRNNIYYNPGETGTDQQGNDKTSNNIDDDNNGFTDDYMGWDFTDRVNLPEDTTVDIKGWDNYPYDPERGSSGFHGTAVAGIACAVSDNSIGIAGVAPGAKLLNLRAFDNTGNGEDDDVASAILYAVKMKANVINMSFGDTKFSYVLRDVIKYAYEKGVVLVASSGNSNDSYPHYPSGFDEVISVGRSTEIDSYTGTYGSTLDLLAPGNDILSTDMEGKYNLMSGTSASAPHVSAAAAIILSINNNFTSEEVKQILKSSADDIGSPGWDIRTGAGRLNLNKALNILSPAKIKFNYPYQEFTTNQDTININITVMSPYFVKYSLFYGSGVTPDSWISLAADAQYQVFSNPVYTLNTSSLGEGSYTLRLVVTLSTGNTTEERINFNIQRTAPVIELVGAGPVQLGKSSTIMGELYTGSQAVARMYYRQKGTGDFRFISLDGFAPNTQFVKQLHYGFIPKQIVQPGTSYEIYFEAESPGGLKSVLNNNGSYYNYNTDAEVNYSSLITMPFTLPSGDLFEKAVSFLSGNYNEILLNSFSEVHDSVNFQYKLFSLEGNSFIKKGILTNKIPVDAADYNNNGKIDLLSRSYPKATISEQVEPETFNLSDKFQKDTSYFQFYPILAADLNNDGRPEVVSNHYNTTTRIFKINNDLSIDQIGSISNSTIDSNDYSGQENYNVTFKYTAIAADADGDDINELWLLDYDGDLYSYRYNNGTFIKSDSLVDNLFKVGESRIIASGDYNGDGSDEIAVLYTGQSVALYFVLRIISFNNHQPEVLFEKVFLDQSAEYSGLFSKSFQSLKFIDTDNDNRDELILNIFPDVYVYKYTAGKNNMIYFDEGINNETIFSGDLNGNGVPEIGLQYAEGFRFYEFALSNKPQAPGNISGYSIDSIQVVLKWTGNAEKYLIYRGPDKNSLALYDSVTSTEYYDNNLIPQKNYCYAIKQVDNSKEIPVSDLSKTVSVYTHTPAALVKAEAGRNNILLQFSEKINSTVNDLKSFEVPGIGYPNSVSASSGYSYLLSFNENFPEGNHSIIIKGLNDYYGSYIKQDTIAFIVNPVTSETEFFISGYKIIDPFNIELNFNDAVNESDVKNVINYLFEPENHVASVAVNQENKKSINLLLVKERPVGSIGKEYRLKVNNIRSASGVKINDEAGSYVVLTGYSESLADVYVYPSPVIIKNGESKMMFANLPKRADIKIFNLSGKQLFTLEERDGNGGVEYNLKDDEDNTLNSGIYIYRIVRLDDNNNEVEEKIGKFAVIR